MDEDPTDRREDEGEHATPEPARRDAAARAGDLARMAEDAQDATFGDTRSGATRVPGVLSGDVGPKGKVSAQMRSLSRAERATYGEVPHGSVQPGGGWLFLLPMLGIAVAIIGLVALLGWLLS